MSASDLDTYSRDMWPRLLLALRAGVPSPYRPQVVVWPESTREVAAIVRLAGQHQIPVVPYGGGSGVCGGAVPIRGGIVIDLKRMDAMAAIQREDMICDVEAGIGGERFERALGRRGYTFGNFPSSIYCSTVGGWLSTRAAGQMSTKYGKVEDRVAGLTVVTGRGDIIHTDAMARAGRGPDWTQLMLGSEGTLGIITSARLRLSPAPALRLLRGYQFESVAHGIEAIRRVMQRGLRPAVVRLYDPIDTLWGLLSGSASQHDDDAHAHAGTSAASEGKPRWRPPMELSTGAVPAIMSPSSTPGVSFPSGHSQPSLEQEQDRGESNGRPGLWQRLGTLVEGGKQQLSLAMRQNAIGAALMRPKLLGQVANLAAERGLRRGCKLIVGVEGARVRTEVEGRLVFGEIERSGGRDLGEGPGRHWLERRYAVSYSMSPMFRLGAFVDTMEVASTWERLIDLYNAVREAIGRHALVMAHFSHAYAEGCSIYFTFAAVGRDLASSQRIYDAIWADGLAAATRVGGTISHHHGVGLLKAAHMSGEHREAMRLLRALKQTLDPRDIMNPGKLGLDQPMDMSHVTSVPHGSERGGRQ